MKNEPDQQSLIPGLHRVKEAFPLSSVLNGHGDTWVSAHRERNRTWFELYSRIDALCHKVRAQLRWDANDPQRRFVNALYHRSLSLFESVYVIAEKGFMAESRILSRSLLELTFVLVAALKDKTFPEKYASGIAASETKLLNQSLPHLTQYLPQEKLEKLKKQQRGLQPASKGINPNKVEPISILAGLHDRYDTAYRALCRSTHVGPHDLDQYLVLDQQRRITGFQYGPSSDHFEMSMFISADTMMLILRSVCPYNNIDAIQEWMQLAGELTKLGKA